jgi:hypothetical protein
VPVAKAPRVLEAHRVSRVRLALRDPQARQERPALRAIPETLDRLELTALQALPVPMELTVSP